MSDNWLRLIPTEPGWVPSAAQAAAATALLRSLAPNADEIEAVSHPDVVFVDAGANFERVGCSVCGEDLSLDWWQERISVASDDAFRSLTIRTPCCDVSVSLNDLSYDWPQGFARFELEAMNPGRGKLSAEELGDLAETLGAEVREIWTHI
jgi:hypothetical protein